MQPILVLGEAGTGKTFSTMNLDSTKTAFINIAGKELIYPGWRKKYSPRNPTTGEGNMWSTKDHEKIVQLLYAIDANTGGKFDWVENIIIDDFQYLMGFEFMERADEGGWDRFNEIAMHAHAVIMAAREMKRDFFICIMGHTETTLDVGVRREKIKTVGKMLDNLITPEGLFTVVLYSRCYRANDGSSEYYFETNNNGKNTARSPYKMFDTFTIPNDLAKVKEIMVNYNS